MQEHEDKDVEPDPAGAEAGAPRNRQQGGLVAETAWGLVAGVVVVVLLVVVVEIRVVELLVVGFGASDSLNFFSDSQEIHCTSQHLVSGRFGEVSSNPANG